SRRGAYGLSVPLVGGDATTVRLPREASLPGGSPSYRDDVRWVVGGGESRSPILLREPIHGWIPEHEITRIQAMVEDSKGVSQLMEHGDFVAFFEPFPGGANSGPSIDLQGQDDLRTLRVDHVVGSSGALAREGFKAERGAIQAWRHCVSDNNVSGFGLRHELGP